MAEIIDCEEFNEISVRLSSLMQDGELQIDPRIAQKGYLSAAFKGGQVILRTTKFVGMIPLAKDVSVRVRPRASITNLAFMLSRSQKAPTAISGFARGYTSKFVGTNDVERLFGKSLVDDANAIVRRGLIKRYHRPLVNAPWKGRFLVSETVRKHAAKGINFRHEFDQSILTTATIDNIALREALKRVIKWYREFDRQSQTLAEANKIISNFANVSEWTDSTASLVYALKGHLAGRGNIRSDYSNALWSSYAILDGCIPDVGNEGTLRMDSLILDVSEVFEAYLRRELSERLRLKGFKVYDGWKKPQNFFTDSNRYSVHPDMIVVRDGKIVAILDAKYKPDVSEQDRYEVLSFMDVMKVDVGGFVCPARDQEKSRPIGLMASGKQMTMLRFDLAANNPSEEADKFASNVEKMIVRRSDFQ